MTDFDAPFLVAHAQYIDFKRSWADGLAELLATLEETYRVPRRRDSAGETMDYWREVHVRHGRLLKTKSEPLVSNWLAVERLPETISLYDFRGGISIGAAQREMKDAKRPLAPFRRGFLAFCPLYDLQAHFGPSLPLEVVDEVGTQEFLDDGWRAQGIGKWDAHNQFSNLVRQAMELTLRGRGLSAYELASTQLAWWGKVGAIPSGQVRFSWEGGPKGRRQLVGFSEKRSLHWHYGSDAEAARLSVSPRPPRQPCHLYRRWCCAGGQPETDAPVASVVHEVVEERQVARTCSWRFSTGSQRAIAASALRWARTPPYRCGFRP